MHAGLRASLNPTENRQRYSVLAVALLFSLLATQHGLAAAKTKHRLIILADMGNEPDEEQQMVHMLMYCNEFELEGLIAVTGKFLRKKPQPDLFHKLIRGYGYVEGNLRLHADGWPAEDDLHRLVKAGQQGYGIEDVGPGHSSPGSKLIAAALQRDDSRPLHIVVNAGANTLAQALQDLRASEPPTEVDRLVRQLRVFENGSQDNAGAWICHHFPNIHWIRSNYQTYCYGGPSRTLRSKTQGGFGPHSWKPYARSALGQHQWALEHVISQHGPLGGMFPLRLFKKGQLSFIEGGGTIPWMGLVQHGVYDPDHPHWGSFSGRFTRDKVENYWSRHADIRPDEEAVAPFSVFREASDEWTNPVTGVTLNNEFTPVWRWRDAMFNDFRCRMDWCVSPRDEANHNPVAHVNKDSSNQIYRQSVTAGQPAILDAYGSVDPDGDEISYHWSYYREAGTWPEPIRIGQSTRRDVRIDIPEKAAGNELHFVLEVRDQSRIAPMSDFRRIILSVEPPVDRASKSTSKETHHIRFEKHTLTERYYSDGITAADINADGHTDIVSGPFWYAGPEFTTAHMYFDAVPQPPAPNPTNSMFNFVHDFSGDGKPDILVLGRVHKHEAAWYENPGDPDRLWKRHYVFERVRGESPTLVDLDADGFPEVITHWNGRWGRIEPNTTDATKAWDFLPVGPDRDWPQFYHGEGVGDVNRDGRLDLVINDGWYEQPVDSSADDWPFHATRFSQQRGGAQMLVEDIDNDGDSDIISSLHAHEWGLAWYEQADGSNGESFTEHVIMSDRNHEDEYGVAFSQPHALAVADIDSDGRYDIITGKRLWAHGPSGDIEPNAPPVLYWFRNTVSETGRVRFVPQLIDDKSGVGVQLTVADVDSDGRPDVLTVSKLGAFVFLNRGD